MAYYEPTGGVSAASAPPPEKRWRTVLLMVNGIRRKVRFEESTITGLFRPFLQRLTRLQQQSGRRLIVFLAAPPAVGKSTLTLFLEKLSLATPGLTPLQALGLDGFHYHNEYLNTHSCERDGQIIPLYQIKGAPETYDVSHFRTKMRQLREVRELRWPVYDRMQHDVVEDVQRIHRPIILIEGNWLLLRDAPWADARQYADYTVFIKAHPNDLKMRLVNRKMQGTCCESCAAPSPPMRPGPWATTATSTPKPTCRKGRTSASTSTRRWPRCCRTTATPTASRPSGRKATARA